MLYLASGTQGKESLLKLPHDYLMPLLLLCLCLLMPSLNSQAYYSRHGWCPALYLLFPCPRWAASIANFWHSASFPPTMLAPMSLSSSAWGLLVLWKSLLSCEGTSHMVLISLWVLFASGWWDSWDKCPSLLVPNRRILRLLHTIAQRIPYKI